MLRWSTLGIISSILQLVRGKVFVIFNCIFVMLLGLTACFSLTGPTVSDNIAPGSEAQMGRDEGSRSHGGGSAGKVGPEAFGKFRKELNLSADQEQKLQAIELQYNKESTQLDLEWKALHEQQKGRPYSGYFHTQESALLKQIGQVQRDKREKSMLILNTEQRRKWIEFHRYLQNK